MCVPPPGGSPLWGCVANLNMDLGIFWLKYGFRLKLNGILRGSMRRLKNEN